MNFLSVQNYITQNIRSIYAIFFALIFITKVNLLSQNNYQTNDLPLTITKDSMGIYVNKNNFNPNQLFPKEEWEGNWIWLNKNKFYDYQKTFSTWINNNEITNKKYRALFRKKFKIDKIPDIAILNISGDVSFRAYLNGNFICQGPPNIGSDYEDKTPPQDWYFTTHDIKNNLIKGENIIAVEVFSFDFVLSETTSGNGKFICNIDSAKNQTFLSTDNLWKAELDTSYSSINNILIFNSYSELSNWTKLNYDDKNWSDASILDADKYQYLEQSQIQTPLKVKIEPTSVVKNFNNVEEIININDLYNQTLFNEKFKLDFGKNITGFYSFSINASKNDTIKIYPSEKSQINRPFIYVCKQGENNYTIPYLNVFRNLTFEIISKSGLKINSIEVLFSSYPINYLGNFECSDPFFTKLWEIIRRTTQMCMQSLYLDSPLHQEPLACTGDYLIESMSNYYAFGDPWLIRQDLIKTAKMLEKNNYDMFHTSYSLLWVQMLSNYFQYTSDTILVKELVGDVNKLNALFETYLDSNYLLSQAPDYMFMDWIKINKFNAHHPPAVIGMGYLTAFYYKSLIEGAKLNDVIGNNLEKESNLNLAEKIKLGINKCLWDEQKELYKDGIPFISKVNKHFWLPEDENIITYSPHINTLAVLYDIAPAGKKEMILNYVLNQNEIELQPYFTYFVLSAIEHIEKFETDGLKLIDKWKNGIDLETYTLKENWNDETEFGYKGDYSHAWGGSPLYFMSKNILGISTELSGFEKIKIKPFVSEEINWAKGDIPINQTQKVEVNWERKDSSIYKYEITIPENYYGILYHPTKYKLYNFILNNKSCSSTKPTELSEGKHKIEYKISN
ncbi:MAG: hypothetical protein IPH62_13470 [Ignavibacteriae bacterium]|nr:hypothetical protein [Ignavibacteriota bacterium]